MKAIVIEEYGHKEQLKEKEIPLPKIEDNQVLVEVYATSINPVDWIIREGYFKERVPFEFPIILGWDAAGIVKEIGKAVTKYKVGDRVFSRPATTSHGTYAEYTAVDENLLAAMPKNLTFEEAAAVPLAGETAWYALVELGKIKAGDKVLIHAGAGGVGSFAIQFAKHFGAYVASTASGENGELIKSLGADQFINYKEEDFENSVHDFDLVFDTIGGETQDKSFHVLKKGGKIISITTPPDEAKARENEVEAGYFLLDPDGEMLSKIGELIANGEVKPVIDKVFPFSEQGLRDAHERSESHHARGKIVIKVK